MKTAIGQRERRKAQVRAAFVAPSSRSHYKRDSVGAALVETAIVAPLLLLIALGVLEMGYLFMHKSATANAAGVAARAGAATSDQVVTDQRILDYVRSRKLATLDAQYIVVYKANSADGKVPNQCASGTELAGVCNVYQVNADGSFSGAGSAWPVSARNAGVDYLGVAVIGNHNWITGAFGGTQKMSDSSVARIEPIVAEVGPPGGTSSFGEGPAWGTDSEVPNMPGPNLYDQWFFATAPIESVGGATPGGGGGDL